MARGTRSSVQRRRDLTERTLRFQRILIAATLLLTPLVFWRATLDIFGIVKAALVLVGALLVGAVALVRVFRSGRLQLPRHPVLWPLGAFLLLATVATFTSYSPMLSFVGHYSRFSGLLLYLTYAWLFIAALRAYDDSNVHQLAGAIVAGAGLVALYGVFQELGIDPIQWGTSSGVTSTLGNPNYVSSQVAFAIPIATWGVLDRRWSVGLRAASGATLLLLLAALPLAGSAQGYLATAVGLGVLALAWALGRVGRLKRVAVTVWGVAAAGGITLFVVALQSIGPFASITRPNSFRMRLHDMRAAVNMALEFPLLGVGFDRYGGYYHALRAPEATQLQEIRATTSVPHSVHLDMFASGGFPLGIVYLAFVVVIFWFVVRTLFSGDRERLLTVGGIGGGWAAYQAASAVSIDVPSLAVTGWVLAAATLVVSAPPRWPEWVLPWARVPEELSGKEAKRERAKRRARTDQIAHGAYVVVAVVLLAGLWMTSAPLRADVHAKDAQILQQSNPPQAVQAADIASDKVSWEPKYPMQVGTIHTQQEQYEPALEAFRDAAERDPRDLGAVVSTAHIAERLGDMEMADSWYEQAVKLEPHDPEIKADVARFLMRQEEFAEARELLESALELEPEEPEYWLNLGFAREKTGDLEAARAAYERTLELDPENEKAEELLRELGGPS